MSDRSESMRRIMRLLVYPVQGVLIVGALKLCRMLPITWAAGFGAGLFRLVGPRLKAHKIARRNLEHAFPEKNRDEIDRILRGVWDNLGRGAGEWSQVDKIATTGPDSRVEVIGEEHLLAARDGEGSFIIFAGHMGNWEVASLVAAHRQTPLANIYRPAANPWVERMFLKVRGRFCSELLPKGRGGAKRMLGVLREGKPLGLLVDQKLNEGVPIPFFGRDAMTASAPAEMVAAVAAKTAYIEPGSPWENGYCESFNARFRDELLNGEMFYTLREAQILIEQWRIHYNTVRPHSSLGY